MSWYAALGVQSFDFSSVDIADPARLRPALPNFTYRWLRMEWIKEKRSWSRGQLWAAHDCVFRARAQGRVWVLFLDVDEFIHLGGNSTLADLAETLQAGGFDAATFGSSIYPSEVCVPYPPREWSARIDVVPECTSGAPPALCWGNMGRRKYMVNAQTVDRLNIHDPSGARKTNMLNATETWIMHCRASVADYTKNGEFESSSKNWLAII